MNRIAIHSVPRSGSTWLGQIFNSCPYTLYRYQPLFSYAFKGRLTATSTRSEIETFFDEIAKSSDSFLTQQKQIEDGIIPSFEKSNSPSHVVYKEVRYHHIIENLLEQDSAIKVIGIVRNPLEVISSWVMAPKEFKPWWDIYEQWRSAQAKNGGRIEEFFGFDAWKSVAQLFLNLQDKFHDRFCLVNYAELVNDPKSESKRLFKFCGLPVCEQTETFLIDSTTRNDKDTYSVFKKKKNTYGWIRTLPLHIVDQIRAETKSARLEQFLV